MRSEHEEKIGTGLESGEASASAIGSERNRRKREQGREETGNEEEPEMETKTRERKCVYKRALPVRQQKQCCKKQTNANDWGRKNNDDTDNNKRHIFLFYFQFIFALYNK